MFAKARGETATILEIAGGEGVFGGFLRALRRSLSSSRVVRRGRIAGPAAVRRMRRAVAERSGRAAPSPFAASAAPPSAGSGSRCGAAIRAPSAFADRRRDGAGCAPHIPTVRPQGLRTRSRPRSSPSLLDSGERARARTIPRCSAPRSLFANDAESDIGALGFEPAERGDSHRSVPNRKARRRPGFAAQSLRDVRTLPGRRLYAPKLRKVQVVAANKTKKRPTQGRSR